MGPCCVDGCNGEQEDTVYFEFPASRGLRKKWLDILKIGNKVPIGSVVCSQHFNRDSYEIIRGKVRLKRKVVPSLQLTTKTSVEPNLETTENLTVNTVLPKQNNTDNTEHPQPDSTTDNIEDVIDKSLANESDREARVRGKATDLVKVVSRGSSTRSSGDRVPPLPDPKQPPDFEDMITNYQIVNRKPNALLPQHIEIEVPPMCDKDDAIVLDEGEDAPPVFIEIPVEQDTSMTNAGNEDCLMVLESVQVDIDPTALMLPEQDLDEERQAQRDLHEANISFQKKEDPISLLTSSDESDVVIQEPEIDTVEVSDETDEDDMPLVKLLKNKQKDNKKKQRKGAGNVGHLMWGGAYDFYCVKCHFNTSDSVKYNLHLQEHQRVLQVCAICNYTTSSKKQLTRHMRKHREEKRYKCNQCEYKARHNMALMYHLEAHENDKKQVEIVKKGFRCKKCRFNSVSEAVVLKHVRTCGLDFTSFTCDKCDYTAQYKCDLKRHWISVHNNGVAELDSDDSYKGWED